MAIVRTPICNDDGSERTGTVLNNDWKQELYNQIDAADAAQTIDHAWQDIPYVASNFPADTVTSTNYWLPASGSLQTHRWRRVGDNTVIWTFSATNLPTPPGPATPQLHFVNLPWRIYGAIESDPVGWSNAPSFVHFNAGTDNQDRAVLWRGDTTNHTFPNQFLFVVMFEAYPK
jgi:hypothetical protein